jgi:hypothetical protein
MAKKPYHGPERRAKPIVPLRGRRGARGPRGAQGDRGDAGPPGLIDHRLDALPDEIAAVVKELRIQFQRFAQIQQQVDDLTRSVKDLQEQQRRSNAQLSELLSSFQKSN